MKRRTRTELLINGSRATTTRMSAEIVKRYDVQTLEEPNHGLVMIQMRETAQKTLFYIGELFVTECKVRIGDTIGIGIVKGDEAELAYDLAVIDAAYNAEFPEIESWTALLMEEEERLAQMSEQFSTGVMKTKVSFETMADD